MDLSSLFEHDLCIGTAVEDWARFQKLFASPNSDPTLKTPLTVSTTTESPASLDDTKVLLSDLEGDPKRSLVMGSAKTGNSETHPRRAEFFEDSPCRWLFLDFDDAKRFPDETAIFEALPGPLAEANCLMCKTSSYGLGKKTGIRLVFHLDAALGLDDMRRIAAHVGADPSIYSPGHLLLTAAPGGPYAPHVEGPRTSVHRGLEGRETVVTAPLMALLPPAVEKKQATEDRVDGERFLITADELRSMLALLPVAYYQKYASWLDIAAAARHSAVDIDEAFLIFDSWSDKDPDYENRTEDRHDKWDSLARKDGPRLGFFRLAREVEKHGGQVPREIKERMRTRYPRSELGNAQRFLDRFGDDFVYVSGIGWHHWDGRRWMHDREGLTARKYAATLGADIRDEARHIEDGDEAKRHFSWAVQSEKASMVNSVLKLCEPQLCVDVEQLDRDLYALNCLNGTVDLRTGKMHEHRRNDLITKLAPVEYDPNAKAPRWEKFLRQCLPSDELRAYLRRSIGYAATGDVTEQVLIFHHGEGSNGKGTFIRAILDALGDYGDTAAPGLLIASKSERHPTELVDLRGARFLSIQENDDGVAFNEARLKWLTGDDVIKGRKMHRDFISFKPTHKFHVASNHRPRVKGTDYAIWRRIHLVPWGVKFEGAAKDPGLTEKLSHEMSGILRWIVEGATEWYRDRLQPPAEVRAAVEKYRADEDRVAQWVAERTVADAGAQTKASELYKDFALCCRDSKDEPVSQTAFGRRLGEMGFFRVPKKAYVVWAGIRLRSYADDSKNLEGLMGETTAELAVN